MDPAEFVEAAELIITESGVGVPSESLLHDVLSQAGLIWALTVPETGELPTVAQIFDALVYRGDTRTREQLEKAFEVLALPSTVLSRDLDEGDVLIRRGEGDAAEVALIASPVLLDLRGAAAAGLTPESTIPGFYVHVVEAGREPRTRNDAFARRVADSNAVTPVRTLLLRIRPDSVPNPLEADR